MHRRGDTRRNADRRAGKKELIALVVCGGGEASPGWGRGWLPEDFAPEDFAAARRGARNNVPPPRVHETNYAAPSPQQCACNIYAPFHIAPNATTSSDSELQPTHPKLTKLTRPPLPSPTPSLLFLFPPPHSPSTPPKIILLPLLPSSSACVATPGTLFTKNSPRTGGRAPPHSLPTTTHALHRTCYVPRPLRGERSRRRFV